MSCGAAARKVRPALGIAPQPAVGGRAPWNVVLGRGGEGTGVEAMDPMAVVGIAQSEEVKQVAADARERLSRVIASLELS